jgi:hypothetical protein
MLKQLVKRVDRFLDTLERLAAAQEKLAGREPDRITIQQTLPSPPSPMPEPGRGPGLPGIAPWQPYNPGPTFPPPNNPFGPTIWGRDGTVPVAELGDIRVATGSRLEPGTAYVAPHRDDPAQKVYQVSATGAYPGRLEEVKSGNLVQNLLAEYQNYTKKGRSEP